MANSGYVDNWQSGKPLPECNLHMLTHDISSDVSFRVGIEKKTIRAHRYVLISRSCVFSAMLCGPLAEKDEITITDVSPEEFKDFLRYLYSETAEFSPVNATAMLYLARKYAVGSLESMSVSYLESCLCVENACIVLEQAHSFDVKTLYKKSLKLVQENVADVLMTEGFGDLCSQCFHEVIISAGAIIIPEAVFTSAVTWAKRACAKRGITATPEHLRSVLYAQLRFIYFPDMGEDFFVKTVVPSGILTDKECVTILSHRVCSDVSIAPFRTRFQKKPKEEPPKKPVPTFNLSLYTSYLLQNHKGSPDDIYSCDDVYIRCNHDILLHGIHMFSSDRRNMKFRIKIFKYRSKGFGELSHDVEVSVSGCSSVNNIATARLVCPISLEQNVQYHFQTQLVSGHLPTYNGIRHLKQEKYQVGQHVFETDVKTVKVRFISGFVFSETEGKVTQVSQKPKRELMSNSLTVHL